MYKILVMMSTYNGEKYIDEQIVSILKQSNVCLKLLIRDDGSTDGTIKKIRYYKERHNNIELIVGDNIGAAESFMELIRLANRYFSDFDYYAFSDQDDVWLNKKLERAVSFINDHLSHKYILYSSNMNVVNDKLELLYKTQNNKYSYHEYLLRNNVAGCTMVFNKNLCRLIDRYYPKYIEMHDSWILRIILSIDDSYFILDDKSYILYRQHNNNVIGSNNSLHVKIKYKMKNLFSKKHITSKTSMELILGYSRYLNNEKKYILSLLCKKTNIKLKLMIFNEFNKIKFSTLKRKYFFIWDLLFGNL